MSKIHRNKLMDDDWHMPDFPWIGGQGSCHDLRDAPEVAATPARRRKRYSLREMIAGMSKDRHGEIKVGFLARRP